MLRHDFPSPGNNPMALHQPPDLAGKLDMFTGKALMQLKYLEYPKPP